MEFHSFRVIYVYADNIAHKINDKIVELRIQTYYSICVYQLHAIFLLEWFSTV